VGKGVRGEMDEIKGDCEEGRRKWGRGLGGMYLGRQMWKDGRGKWVVGERDEGGRT